MNRVIKELSKLGYEYLRDFPMSRYTSMRVGGVTNLIVYPKNHLELIKILDMLTSFDFQWMVLGGGSNIVVGEEGIEGVLVSTKKMRDIEILEDGCVSAESGAVLGSVLNRAIQAELTGLEFAAGIPGTVGGAIIMNAGANEGEIKDVVEEVWIWLNGKEIVLSREEVEFRYRKSHLPEGSVATRAKFRLKPGKRCESERTVKEYLDKRWKTQPIEMPNAGCIFKNPSGIPAGKLLDELGFKGFQIGGAKFSEIHANFIVNSGGARAADVIRLIEAAKEEVFLRSGMLLETEVKIIGKENK